MSDHEPTNPIDRTDLDVGSEPYAGVDSQLGPLGREILELFQSLHRLEATLSERIAAFDTSREW